MTSQPSFEGAIVIKYIRFLTLYVLLGLLSSALLAQDVPPPNTPIIKAGRGTVGNDGWQNAPGGLRGQTGVPDLSKPKDDRSFQPAYFAIGKLQYAGGGDWYSNPSSLGNLLIYFKQATGVPVAASEEFLQPTDEKIFNYPLIYLNGHGNIRFSDADLQMLRTYLTSGGFLFADDNYGMDPSFRREIKRVLPDAELVELPFSHPIFHQLYDFPNGTPKIHEHDNKPAQGYGIFLNGRLAVFYSYQSDLGDGWEDPNVHRDPQEKRESALKMGVDVILYVMEN